MSNTAPRIYFGRIPDGIDNANFIDSFFPVIFATYNYHYDRAVEALIKELKPNEIYHTLNLLIPNFMFDDQASDLFWLIDAEGNHVHMKEDEHMQKKLTMMGPGDVLCDDARSFDADAPTIDFITV